MKRSSAHEVSLIAVLEIMFMCSYIETAQRLKKTRALCSAPFNSNRDTQNMQDSYLKSIFVD